MISVLGNWIYICWVCGSLGLGFAVWIERKTAYRIRQWDVMIMSGIVMATVYAQVFSLFAPVGRLANVILILLCIGVCSVCRKEMIRRLQAMRTFLQGQSKMQNWLLVLVGLLLLLWMAFWTSRGYIHYDTDLYHAQSIRWIEEYGVVKGLGNLHFRFAYNSSLFAVSALFSMKWLGGQSLHGINGFLGVLLVMEISRIGHVFHDRKLQIADFARTAAFYYLVIAVDEMISPASDYAIMFVLFWIVIKWLSLLEQEKSEVPYALLCVIGAYAVTLKLTAGLLLILVIKPVKEIVCRYDRKKARQQIVMYLLMGIMIVAPWMIRTAIISGYLLYPFAGLDVLSVDYKMPASAVIYDANEIKVWGRALYDVNLIHTPVNQWMPHWFTVTLSAMEKIIIVADVCMVLFFVFWSVSLFVRWRRVDKAEREYYLVMVAVVASYLFWQFSAPLIRYGYAYCLLLIAVGVGVWMSWLIKQRALSKWLERCMILVVVLVFIWKGTAMVRETLGTVQEPFYLSQKEYGHYDLTSYQLDGVTIYIPTEGDQVGYAFFPAIPYENPVRFRGNGLKEGFLPAE